MSMLIICLCILAANISILFGGYFVFNKIRAASVTFTQAFEDYFTLRAEDGLTDFDRFANSFAEVLAQRIGVTTQASIRGALGGNMKGLNSGLEDVAKAENPALALADGLPKSLRKNPLAMMGLNILASRVAAAGEAATPDNGQHTSQVKFNF